MPKSFQNPANDNNDAYSNSFYLLFREHIFDSYN